MARFPTARGVGSARGRLPRFGRAPEPGQGALAPLAQTAAVAFELADRQDLEAQTSEAAKQLAQAESDWQATVLEHRKKAAEDGAGHAAKLDAAFESFQAARLEAAPTRARSYVDRGLTQLGARSQQQARRFEAEKSLEKRVADLTATIKISQNNVATDPGSLAEKTAQITAAIQTQEGLPASTRERLIEEAREQLANSALTARIERDPGAVKAELQAGKWDAVLPPPARARLESQARGEVERRAARARSLARQAAADARIKRNQEIVTLSQEANAFALELVTGAAPEEGSFAEFAATAERLQRPDLAARYRYLADNQEQLEEVAALPVGDQKVVLANLVGSDAGSVVRAAAASENARLKAESDALKAADKEAREAAELEAERLLADVETAIEAEAPPEVLVEPLTQAFAKAQEAGDDRLSDQVRRIADRTLAQIAASGMPAAEAEALSQQIRRTVADSNVFQPGALVFAQELERSVAANEKGLAEDPLAWSLQRHGRRGGTEAAPEAIAWREAGLAERVAERRALAVALAKEERLAEGRILPFYRQELTELTRGFADGVPEQQLALFTQLSALSPPQQKAVAAHIAGETGGVPLAAAMTLAGGDQADQAVALQILQGRQFLAKEPTLAPANKEDRRDAIDEYFGSALAALPDAQPALVEAAVAVYAAHSKAQGDTSGVLDQDRLEMALDAVTGGVIAYGDGRIIAPWRGADDGDVEEALERLTLESLGGPIKARDGSILALEDLVEDASLRSVDQGLYQVLLGGYQVADPRAPGQPLTVDLGAFKGVE